MNEFKNVIVKCKKDNDFNHDRNVNYSCGCDFMIDEEDVYSVMSLNCFSEDIKEYYTICPICGYINKLDERKIPIIVKEKADNRSNNEKYLYRKNNLRSELIFLDMLSSSKPVLKRKR